jgi:hypothetical protein
MIQVLLQNEKNTQFKSQIVPIKKNLLISQKGFCNLVFKIRNFGFNHS